MKKRHTPRRPSLYGLVIWFVGAIALAVVGCDTGAKGSTVTIPNGDHVALNILVLSEDGDVAPVVPDEKVPRKDCTHCKGTGVIRQGDGHTTVCPHCDPALSKADRCLCGPDCICENCPEDCLGEYITLASVQPADTPGLHQVALANETGDGSNTCTKDGCSTSNGCSTGHCENSSGGPSSHAGHGHVFDRDAPFMERGPARRAAKRVGAGILRVGTAPFRLLFRGCCR